MDHELGPEKWCVQNRRRRIGQSHCGCSFWRSNCTVTCMEIAVPLTRMSLSLWESVVSVCCMRWKIGGELRSKKAQWKCSNSEVVFAGLRKMLRVLHASLSLSWYTSEYALSLPPGFCCCHWCCQKYACLAAFSCYLKM